MDLCAVPNLSTDLRENDLSQDALRTIAKNTALTASEERVTVNRGRLGTSVVRVRILAAGLVLLGAGCAVLGWGSRSRQTAANAEAQLSAIAKQGPTIPSLVATAHSEAKGEVESRARSLFAGLPLSFEPNRGQGNLDVADPRAKFVTRGSGYSLFLGSEGAILSLASREPSKQDPSKRGLGKHAASQIHVESLQMKLAGAHPEARVSGGERCARKRKHIL